MNGQQEEPKFSWVNKILSEPIQQEPSHKFSWVNKVLDIPIQSEIQVAPSPPTPSIADIAWETMKGGAKDLLDTLTGIGETGLTVASGVPAYLMGVGAQAGKGIWDWLTEGFRWKDQKIEPPKPPFSSLIKAFGENKNVKEKVASLFTYMPKTKHGELFAQIPTAPFEMYFAGVKEVSKLMTDDPDEQSGIEFLGDLALIFGLPAAKKAFARRSAINKGEILREINQSEVIPKEIKVKAHKVNKYPFFPKNAPQVWYDVWDATGGKGIRPFKDVAGKFIELEEYRGNVPKQLRRRNGLPPDEVADMLGFEDSEVLYRTLQYEKKPLVEEPGIPEYEQAAQNEVLIKEAEILEATQKPKEQIGEFIDNTFMDGERLREITNEVLMKKKKFNEAVDEVKGLIEDTIGEPEFKATPEQIETRIQQLKESIERTKDVAMKAAYRSQVEGLKTQLRKANKAKPAEINIEELSEKIAKGELKATELTADQKAALKKAYVYEEVPPSEKPPGPTISEEMEGSELSGVVEKISEEVRRKQEKEYPDVGLTIKPTFPITEAEKFKFESGIEERFEAAKGVPKPTIPERAKELIVSAKNKVTRTYEHLPNVAEFAELKTALKTLEKQSGVTSDRTLRSLQGITINLDRHTQDLFRRKIIIDDLVQEANAGRDLPFGFTKKSLPAEKLRLDEAVSKYPEIQDAINKRNQIWDALRNDYVYWAKKAGVDLESKLTKEDYFRHQVLQYARSKGISQTGKKLRTPPKRGFLKERRGGEFDINTDYFEAEYEVMAQMLYDIEVYKTIDRIGKEYDISAEVKKQAKEQQLEDWHKAIPEGYEAWQPREGNVFYLADTIPARIAEEIQSGLFQDFDILPEKINQALAMGRKRAEWVVKEEVAKTLNDLTQRKPPNWLSKLNKKILRLWKIWTLISPRRYFKYNIRNLTGDADAAFVGNPGGFKKSLRAAKELLDVYAADKPMPKEMQEWFNRGGMETTLQAQELGDIKQLRAFQKFYEDRGGIEKIPIKTWKAYWKTARLTTDFREAILRYSNYLDYLEQIQKSPEGKPRNFGASIPEEITALKDPRDRAFRLSNELLGAYDEISVFGQAFREHAFPFWSWKELNFRRYIRLFKNVVRNNELTSSVGRKLLTGALKTPYMALKVGRFAVKATAFWTILQVWNHLMFPEEEESLPKEVKGRAHIILGKDKNGKVIYFSRIGALSDFLEWFGLDAAPNLVSEYLSGEKSLKDIGEHMIKAPVNQVVQGLSPFLKAPVEIATRRALFPDVFDPKTIRDRGLHLARSLALENEYRAIMGKPAEPYWETVPSFVVYKSDPLESAYHEIFDKKNEYLKKFGKRGEGFWLTPRGSALYDLKLAHRYGDKKAEEKALRDYLQYHVIEFAETGKEIKEVIKSVKQGLKTALENMHPLSGMNKNERNAFVASLDEEERELLAKAIRFYVEVLSGASDLE